jgi:Tol biopolymer transport system component
VNDDTPEPGMVKEEITLPDGRYLIYYTFESSDEDARPDARASVTDAAASDRNVILSRPNVIASRPNVIASHPNVIASRPNVILSLSKDEPTP